MLKGFARGDSFYQEKVALEDFPTNPDIVSISYQYVQSSPPNLTVRVLHEFDFIVKYSAAGEEADLLLKRILESRQVRKSPEFPTISTLPEYEQSELREIINQMTVQEFKRLFFGEWKIGGSEHES